MSLNPNVIIPERPYTQTSLFPDVLITERRSR